jgi:histidyl-tRNA synthetase
MIKSLRGTTDILPPESALWEFVEQQARTLFRQYGYEEIRIPVFERTELFVRTIGETTDIVEKEMYTFKDRKGRSLTLRPEGTAGVVRACLQNKIFGQKIQKLYYLGPMFRYERPQAGRQRQFYQIGVELFGTSSPLADAEVIALMVRFVEKIGLSGVSVNVNSLGDDESVSTFKQRLKDFIEPKAEMLCADCRRRLERNILRVLDCKVPSCREVLDDPGLPVLKDSLSPGARVHYEKVLAMLDQLGIQYREEPRLVRGLDYYTHTIFEVTHSSLGSQDALGGGGRYDNLVESIGGAAVPGIGFAMGVERLIMVLKELQADENESRIDVFLVSLDEQALEENLVLADRLRRAGVSAVSGYEKQSVKSQMRQANNLGVKRVVMRGQEERAAGSYKLKNMQNGEERIVGSSDIIDVIQKQ